jgi:hypothetical protein
MADYHPLISRAVEGLGTNTGEARRALYERARAALVTQLRAVDPPLSESDITRERLALEEAIRKVEAESARKMRAEPRPAIPRPGETRSQVPPAAAAAQRRERAPAPPLPQPVPAEIASPPAELAEAKTEEMRPAESAPATPAEEPAAAIAPRAAPESARSRLLNARVSPAPPREPLRGFRQMVGKVDDLGSASAKAAQAARATRDSYGAAPPAEAPPVETPASPDWYDRAETPAEADEPVPAIEDTFDQPTLEPAYVGEGEPPPAAPRHEAEEDFGAPRPPRSYRGLVQLAVLAIIFVGLAATITWQWSNITGLYQYVSHMRSRQAGPSPQTPASQPKFSGRVPQEQNPGTAAPSGAPGNAATPAVAQRVVLYEEDQNDPQGKRYVGSAIWRTETVSPGPGLAPELAIRADIEIPERKMSVTWSLRRNTDPALPASHTIEIMFKLPPDFPGGGIANVPGVLMKETEQARGTPLAGLAVKVTNGYFLIGLSAVDADVQRNVQLLKTRPWFDIPIVYNSGGRAILAMEKGPPGDRAFADAFAAWGK